MRALCVLAAISAALFSATALAQLPPDLVPGKWLEPVLPEELPELEYPAWANALDRARLESLTGRYKKSLLTIIDADGADSVELALIKGRSLSALGKRAEALEALSTPPAADDPRVQVMRASVLIELTRADEAIAILKQLLEDHPDSIPARWTLGQACEKVGDVKSAVQAYAWFVQGDDAPFARWQNQRERAYESAEDVTCIGRAVDRWAMLTGAYKDSPKLHDALLNTFVRAYDVIDRGYWQAHVAAAEYFLSHDDSKRATEELNAARTANPNDARALVLSGRIALDQFNFDGCDKVLAVIRGIDRESSEADLLEARSFLAQRRPADAAAPIERVLGKQPSNIEALGLLAAVHALQLHDQQVAEVLKRVDQIDVDHDNATSYFEVAEQLGAMRQYPRAADMYKTAIERAPTWTEPRNGLGLLYTQSGDEELAQATLDAAHALDPYNLRATNYLRLLDELHGFARSETGHFIVMYDASVDPVIPEYFGEYLESIHKEVCAAFNHEPSVKTMIEVFPTHDAFSVRTTGTPWIGTVGASTGRVIALVAPRKGEATMGPFNWSQVLRHEYTHTVTLGATDNRIPHWMTEGLAVFQEHAPLRWEWVPMLYAAVKNDELFTLQKLTWAFIRPRRPTDRQLGYAQSFWICSYIEQRYGHEAILKMLDGAKSGLSQDEIFPKVLGRSTSEFESDFFAWAKQQVAGWGYDEETTKKYDELRERGEALVKGKQYAEAVAVWEQIAELRPVDALPHQRLAGLYLTKEINQKDKAIEQLKALQDVELHDNRYAKRIARLYRDSGDLKQARAFAMQAVYTDPYDLDGHELLLQISQASGDATSTNREQRVIPVLTRWIEANRKHATPVAP
ncbi:MAG: tetratricopeptide repeat protein [Tepidisphaeraceae bacterium]